MMSGTSSLEKNYGKINNERSEKHGKIKEGKQGWTVQRQRQEKEVRKSNAILFVQMH